jgi:hypothetical protein
LSRRLHYAFNDRAFGDCDGFARNGAGNSGGTDNFYLTVGNDIALDMTGYDDVVRSDRSLPIAVSASVTVPLTSQSPVTSPFTRKSPLPVISPLILQPSLIKVAFPEDWSRIRLSLESFMQFEPRKFVK